MNLTVGTGTEKDTSTGCVIGAGRLECFSKDTLKKNKKTNPVRYWGGPREIILPTQCNALTH